MRASLLTPIAKAFATDVGCEVSSLGVQVHGGMGYIEETGAAQHYRDARIASIYEGTNGIQAIDLVTRKLPMADGGHVRRFIGEAREIAERTRAELLTPLAKAFSTDIAFEVASLGVQVHGGMGYIEETGAAQTLRDSRIAAIYEGTNGIQAIDLVTRKLPMADGGHVRRFIREAREIAEPARAENRPDFGRMGARLSAALDDLEATSDHLLGLLEEGRTAEALAGATPYLRLFSLAAGCSYLARGALAARQQAAPHAPHAIATARFFAEHLAPETASLRLAITEGAEAVLAAEPALPA